MAAIVTDDPQIRESLRSDEVLMKEIDNYVNSIAKKNEKKSGFQPSNQTTARKTRIISSKKKSNSR